MGRREAERGGRGGTGPSPITDWRRLLLPGGTAHPLATGSLDSREGSAWG